jgi:hypothetical protein
MCCFSLSPLRFIIFAVKNPPEVYVDPGACPFECCVYRDW